MSKALTPLRKEKGNVLVLTAISLIVMMGMLGLAIDLGNAYVNKTRLQNAIDATALSAAISLVNNRMANAVADARATFDANGLSSVNSSNVDICFFNNYSDINASCSTTTPTAASKFVRATVNPGHLLSVATTFARVMGFENLNINASAVSGPLAMNNLCTLVPIVTCAGMTPGTPPTVTDPNCTDGSCYGYSIGTIYPLKQTDWSSGGIGPGNFDLLDVGSGASAVSNAMAGYAQCQEIGLQVKTQTGSASGATADLNVRFDDYTHGRNAQYPPATYPPDTNIAEYFTPATGSFATSYKTGSPTAIQAPSHTGLSGRRVVHTPLVDCSADVGSAGGTQLTVVGMGCFLLSQKVIEGGSSPDKFKVFAEFVIAEGINSQTVVDPLCEIGAKPVPSGNASTFAPARIVLFKDPVSPDA